MRNPYLVYKDILTSIFRRHEPKSFSNVEPLTFAFTKFCKTIGFYSQLEKNSILYEEDGT